MPLAGLETLAGGLRRTLAGLGLLISHRQALDMIAAIPGLRDWSAALACPERVAACRFDEDAAARLVRAIAARHALPAPVDRLMLALRMMSVLFQGSSASSSMQRLIVTTSDSGAGHLKQSRIADKVVPLRDSLVWGPVPAAAGPAAFFKAREAASDADAPTRHELFDWDRAEPALDAWLEVAALCEAFERVELWIDPTPNEQLLLVRLLDWLARDPGIVGKLYVVHAEDPLGGRGPDHPRTIASTARPIGAAELDTAARTWRAWCEPTPVAFHALLQSDLAALPFLRRAIALLLNELPALDTALGATERLLLKVVAPGGVSPHRFFAINAQHNPQRVYAYWEEGRIIDRLATCSQPAIVGLQGGPFDLAMHDEKTRHGRHRRSRLSLSPFGRALLDGTEDFSRRNAVHRWWGGTLLTSDALWRWDAARETLVPPR